MATEHSGLQSVVGDARKGLLTSNQRRWRVVRECVVSAWDELDQRVAVIDTAIKQWRTRLHACVKAKGGCFEHSLP